MSKMEKLLVVALEQAVAAPVASGRLADAGARVIKLERSSEDFARALRRCGPRTGLSHPSIAPYGAFACADGTVILAIQTEPEWAVFTDAVLGAPELATDPRFAGNVARVENRAALDALIAEAFAHRSSAEVIQALNRHGIANGRVRIWPATAAPAFRRWRRRTVRRRCLPRRCFGTAFATPCAPRRLWGNMTWRCAGNSAQKRLPPGRAERQSEGGRT
jgi:crotonobetainyl-CoA:carnitine CoA-transferase CaiB-like acyl-CoA transferase